MRESDLLNVYLRLMNGVKGVNCPRLEDVNKFTLLSNIITTQKPADLITLITYCKNEV
jgi:hypothetical protein